MTQKETDFTEKLLRILLPLSKSHFETARKENKRFEDVGSEKEIYIKKIHSHFSTISSSIDQLKKIEFYLSIDSFPEYYLDNDISEKDYYFYHIENFHIRIISIIDYVFHLINHTLKFGFPKNKINLFAFTENTNLKGSSLITKLKAFEEEFKNMRTDRNKIIHHGDFKSESFEEISWSLINTKLFDFDKEFIEYLNLEKKEKVTELVKTFNEYLEKVEFHLGEIFEEMGFYMDQQIEVYELREK